MSHFKMFLKYFWAQQCCGSRSFWVGLGFRNSEIMQIRMLISSLNILFTKTFEEDVKFGRKVQTCFFCLKNVDPIVGLLKKMWIQNWMDKISDPDQQYCWLPPLARVHTVSVQGKNLNYLSYFLTLVCPV